MSPRAKSSSAVESAVGLLLCFVAGGSCVGQETQVGIVEAYGVESRQNVLFGLLLVVETCQYGALMQSEERILLVTDD